MKAQKFFLTSFEFETPKRKEIVRQVWNTGGGWDKSQKIKEAVDENRIKADNFLSVVDFLFQMN